MAGNEQTLFILGLALGTLVIFGYIAFRNYIKKELDKEPPAIPEATETAQVARKIEREVGKKIAEPVSAIEDQVPPQPTLKVLPSEPEPPTGPVRAAEPAAPSKKKDLGDALSNTRASLFGRIKTLFGAGGKELSDDDRDGLEEILYTSDLGPQTVERLLEAVDEKLGGPRSLV